MTENTKFGKDLKVTILHEDSKHPIRVAIVEYRSQTYLEIRKMYYRGGQLSFGKGVRLSLDGDEPGEVLLCAEGMLAEWLDKEA
jgi:cation transport ATPase